jgi:type I restriction enzyme S subunit
VNWTFAAIGDLCEVSTGQSAPQDVNAFSATGHPFIRAGSLDHLINGGSEDALEKITDENARRFRMRLFPAGTIVFAKSGMSATLGRIYRLRSRCYVVSHLATLIPTGRLDGDFLVRWLEANPPSRLIANEAYPSIKTSVIQNVQIPFPEFSEQRRIATILDKADAIRTKRREALQLADGFLNSAFLDMFGDLATNQKRWQTLPLGELIEDGPTNGLYVPSSDYGSGTPILRIDGFYDGRLVEGYAFKRVRIDERTVQRYLLKNNSVVVNRVNSREYVGKAAFIDTLTEPTVFESNMMNFTVRSDQLAVPFLVEQLGHPFVRNQIAQARKDAVNQSSVNQSDISALLIRIPPLPLQQKFVRLFLAIEAIKAKLGRQLRETKTFFSALSSCAFQGRL